MRYKTEYAEIKAFTTKDGSTIRELMHPADGECQNQSLAEARLPAGAKTLLHKHLKTEEIYHITEGAGLMYLGEERFEVKVGDTVCIPPGTAHCIETLGDCELALLCCCSPAYSHDDTQLLEEG